MSYKHYQYFDVGVFVYRRTLCAWYLPCCFVPYTGGGFYSGGHKCVICIFAAVPAKEKCYLPVSFTSAPLPNLYLFATTRSYAALRAADLDWIIGPGYSSGGNKQKRDPHTGSQLTRGGGQGRNKQKRDPHTGSQLTF